MQTPPPLRSDHLDVKDVQWAKKNDGCVMKKKMWAPKTSLLDVHNSKTAIWFFHHIFNFSTLRIFYVKMVTSEGGRGGGVCTSVVVTGLFFKIKINTFYLGIFWKIWPKNASFSSIWTEKLFWTCRHRTCFRDANQ